jgi:hypothetical protein
MGQTSRAKMSPIVWHAIIDIKSLQNRLLMVCYVMCPLLVPVFQCFFLFIFLLWSLTVQMKQTRQAVRAVKQSILLRCLCMPSSQNIYKAEELTIDI